MLFAKILRGGVLIFATPARRTPRQRRRRPGGVHPCRLALGRGAPTGAVPQRQAETAPRSRRTPTAKWKLADICSEIRLLAPHSRPASQLGGFAPGATADMKQPLRRKDWRAGRRTPRGVGAWHSRPPGPRWKGFCGAPERLLVVPFSNIPAARARPRRPRPPKWELAVLRTLPGQFGLPRSLGNQQARPPACQPFDAVSEGTSSRGPQRGTGSAPNCLETSRIP